MAIAYRKAYAGLPIAGASELPNPRKTPLAVAIGRSQPSQSKWSISAVGLHVGSWTFSLEPAPLRRNDGLSTYFRYKAGKTFKI